MPDIGQLAIDFYASFLEIASELSEDDGKAMAENIGQNLGLAVRPARNKLEELAYSQKKRSQVVADANLSLTPQRENALKMSFDTHLRSMMRKGVAYSAAKMKAENYFGLGGDAGKAPVTMSTKQYTDENWPTLGPPKDTRIAVPVPKGYEAIREKAAELFPLNKRQREEAISNMLIQKAKLK